MDLELEKKEVMASFKNRIDGAHREISELSRVVANGYEFREVECHWQSDYKLGLKILYREDTEPQEVVESQKLSNAERQGSIHDLFPKRKEGEAPQAETEEPKPETKAPVDETQQAPACPAEQI